MLISWLRKKCPQSVKKVLRKPYRYGIYLWYKIAQMVFTSEKDYYCPCCGLRFSRFVDDGYHNNSVVFNSKRYEQIGQDVACPVCHSLPRHRILATWCEQNSDSLKGKQILYFALEYGMLHWLKRNGIPVTSADLFAPADLKLDLERIDQPDNSWDVVFCNHVLEHVKEYKKALEELRRILKPGGKLICSFPIDGNYNTVYEDVLLADDMSAEADRERIRRFGQRDHLRVFGLDSKQLLEGAGFDVSVIDGDTMPVEICPVVGPADYDSNKLFVCVKPD